MSEPYYADDSVTLYHGDSGEILPNIEPDSVDVLLTDPPYFQVKDDEWDRQWKQRDEFLTWLGDILDAATPALKASSSVWVFTSPGLASTIEREVVAPRYRVLNSIRWAKKDSTHNRAKIDSLRRYQTAWEGIIFAEVSAAVGPYIRAERIRAGWSTNDLEVALGYQERNRPGVGTRLCARWEEGASLPTADTYQKIRAHLNRDGGDYMYRDYEDLCRPFRLNRSNGPVTDVWGFPSVEAYPGKHSCEKPLAMLDHMIEVSSEPGAVILDPFAGSGSTLRAAKDAGRRAIGIEKDEKWCEHAANRLTQDVLDFGGAA